MREGLGPGFLPLAEAAKWAGVSEKTMKRMIHRGLPSHQTGPRGKILLKPCDIEQFMKRPKEGLDQMVEEVMGKLAGKAHLEQRILRINQESGGL